MTLSAADVARARARETILSPADARHVMRVKPVAGRVRVLHRGVVPAASVRARRLVSAGSDMCDPVFCLPPEDVSARLAFEAAGGHRPLKGDRTCADLVGEDGATLARRVAWRHHATLPLAAMPKDRVAFDEAQATTERRPPL